MKGAQDAAETVIKVMRLRFYEDSRSNIEYCRDAETRSAARVYKETNNE